MGTFGSSSSARSSFSSSSSMTSQEEEEPSTIIQQMHAEVRSREVLEKAKEYAFDYLDNLESKPVFPSKQSLEALDRIFDEPIPETNIHHHNKDGGSTTILKLLHQYGAPATTSTGSGGRYFGFVNGGVIPTATAAGWMAQVWDQNAALHVMSPIAAKLEHVVEGWCTDLLGLPTESTAMGLVGGTSVANMVGLAAGRHAVLQKLGWDVNADGLFGAPPIRVIVSEEAHGSVNKALALLGLGNKRIESVPADDQGRICVDQLPPLDSSTMIILQAGHVSTGAFDDFATICDLAHHAGAWVHIDGAFGLWAAASRNLRYLTKGLEKADSWAVDGHKTLNTPYDCGIVLCKHREIMNQAMAASGSYLQRGDYEASARDGMFYTPDMSRRGARPVELWATLRYLGRQGVQELMDTMVSRAQLFGELLSKEEGFHVQNDIVFNQCLVKCDSPEETSATLQAIQASEIMWCGGSVWKQEPAIRISVCSWATTEEDVLTSVSAIVDARSKAMASRK